MQATRITKRMLGKSCKANFKDMVHHITAFEKCERIGYSFFVDWRNIDEVANESMLNSS
jgi:hypothetical protein